MTPIERFKKWVVVGAPDECWLWTGAKLKGGHGIFWDGSKNVTAHRFLYELTVGPIPEGLCGCHRCDVPACVNPAHIFLGTKSENNKDRDSKGRTAFGVRTGHAKLGEVDVAKILADPRSRRRIAADYGVVQSTVTKIKSGKSWKHLQSPS